MKASLIKVFEQRVWHRISIQSKQVVTDHVFTGNNKVITWLAALVKKHLLEKILPGSFHIEIENNGDIAKLVTEGDGFYFNLFRKENLINGHTQEGMEKFKPLTYVLERIFAFSFESDKISESHLTFYSDLIAVIKYGMGKLLAIDPDLQTYEQWVLLCDYLECEHEIFNGWSDHIGDESIKNEMHKFWKVLPEVHLEERAFLGSYGKDNDAKVNYYKKKIASLADKTDWVYVSQATDGMDIFDLKGHIYFRQELLKRIGMDKWLMLADSLQYPILQDHIFLDLDDIDDYTKVICEITTARSLITKPAHLLLIALQNYFEFISRTLCELSNFASGSNSYNHPDREAIMADTKKTHEDWITRVIPDSFASILSVIFPEEELHKSIFFLPFFDWVSSHSKEDLDEERNKDTITLIDIITNKWQDRLEKHTNDKIALISNLQNEQLNWIVFEKLVTLFSVEPGDAEFRDAVCEKYKLYLGSENFRWSAKEPLNFGLVINQAYHFGQVIASYPDALEQWDLFFNDHKVHHEGWMKKGLDYKAGSRESYVLSVGIGISYHLFAEKKIQLAETILDKAMRLLISQYRNMGEYHSTDYTAPLKFAAITIGRHAKPRIEWFVTILLDKVDKLSHLLIIVYELSLYETASSIPAGLRERIKERVENEFWIIENRKSHWTQKHKIDYYNNLKTEILKYVNAAQ